MMSEFERAKRRYASGARACSPLEAEALHIVEGLEKTALAAVYDENTQGGHAREVVASVARVLDVDIDEGPGHRWDPEHMARVIGAADQLRVERDEAKEQAELWRKLAERQDNTAPVRRDLARAEAARDELQRRVEYLTYQVEALSGNAADDVDELKSVIVSQAREIARLKGESE
jgi:hypothetical protein